MADSLQIKQVHLLLSNGEERDGYIITEEIEQQIQEYINQVNSLNGALDDKANNSDIDKINDAIAQIHEEIQSLKEVILNENSPTTRLDTLEAQMFVERNEEGKVTQQNIREAVMECLDAVEGIRATVGAIDTVKIQVVTEADMPNQPDKDILYIVTSDINIDDEDKPEEAEYNGEFGFEST